MICNRTEIKAITDELKQSGQKIVFTNGCFDIIHSGHVIYLTKAHELGDYLIVGLNDDASVGRLKGTGRPINNQDDRAIVLDALKPVDFVVMFSEDTPFELISIIMPDILAKGGDYSFDTIVGADLVAQNGGDVVVIPLVEGKSTTSIINRMQG